MKLIVSIDTEEDNWANYTRTDNRFENLEKLPALQELFDEFGVKPTYLVSFPVASHEKTILLLGSILGKGKCEIGAHCHPWNTPPFEEDINEKNSMLCNLPENLIHAKVRSLHNKIVESFKCVPATFRAGRFGFGANVARAINNVGYNIDTSMTPYVDWTEYSGPDFSAVPLSVFRFDGDDIFHPSSRGHLLEIPVTVGFLQSNFSLANALYKRFSSKPLAALRIIGILDRLRLLNKTWLSPELSDSRRMILFAQCLMRKKLPVLNMFFHSTSLKAGLNDFVRTPDDENRFLKRIRDFLRFAADSGIGSATLSEAGALLALVLSCLVFFVARAVHLTHSFQVS